MRLQNILLWIVISFFFLGGREIILSQTNFWQQTNGPRQKFVSSLVKDFKGQIFAGTDSGIFRLQDDGVNWTRIGLEKTYVSAIAINSEAHIFAGGIDSVFRSTDNGSNWISSRLTAANIQAYITAFAITSDGSVLAGADGNAFTNGGGIYRSSDSGETWNYEHLGDIFCFAIDSTRQIFAGTGDILTSLPGHVICSTDNGNSWKLRATVTSSGPVSLLAINSNDVIFAASGPAVFRSTDNGNTWKFISFTDGAINALVINLRGHIFVGTYKGVYRSSDNGESWIAVNEGLTHLRVLSLAIDANGYLFAGTENGGVFRSIQTTTSVKETTDSIPTTLLLNQNYPNPFNPSTTIQFILPRSGYVTLKVYNTLGAAVATLVEGNLSVGRHQVAWSASGMADGVYLYRLKTGEFVQTKKLVVLK